MWFLESMATQILVVFIIRTNGYPWSSPPHPALALSSFLALAAALVMPFMPVGEWFGFVSPPPAQSLAVALVVGLYLFCAEMMKRMAVGESGR
jgi:Mg2+-importing ATPase